MTQEKLCQAWIKKGKRIKDVEKHLLHHLDEVKELIKKDNQHRFAEITDLIILCTLYMRYNHKDLEKHLKKRFKKFKEKLGD